MMENMLYVENIAEKRIQNESKMVIHQKVREYYQKSKTKNESNLPQYNFNCVML